MPFNTEVAFASLMRLSTRFRVKPVGYNISVLKAHNMILVATNLMMRLRAAAKSISSREAALRYFLHGSISCIFILPIRFSRSKELCDPMSNI